MLLGEIPFTAPLIGGGLLLAIGCGLLMKLLRDGWTARRADQRWYRESLAALRVQIGNADEALRRRPTTASWQGFRRFVVADLVRETADVVSVTLQAEDGRAIAPFEPGQYVTVRATVPGDSKPTVRCYSLSDCARPDYYRITVRAVAAPARAPQLPAGKMSNFITSQLQIGHVLELQAPRGDFFLRPDSRPTILLGAGIGMTPLVAMAHALLESPHPQPVVMICGLRNGQEHPFKQELQKLAAQNSNFLYFPCYSQPLPSDVAGKDFRFGRRVDLAAIETVVPHPDFPFYLCGPNLFMGSLVTDLMKWGVREEDLHFEAFGPSSVQTLAKPAHHGEAESGVQTRVVFQQSEKTEPWSTNCCSLLELAERSGICISAGCRAGNCGMCVTTVLRGKVGYNKQPSAPIATGECLACVAHPDGTDLVLEA